MAVTNYREDFLGRDLVAPTVNALDYLGRAVGATTDPLGRPLRRILRTNVAAVTLGQELSFAGGTKYIVTVAGNTAAAEPAVPAAIGDTVADGTATLRRTK
jgi:hypothetical protein